MANDNNYLPFRIQCELYWASLTKPAQMSGKYEVKLCNLSEAARQKLEDIGISVKWREDKPEMGMYVSCTSKNYPMQAVLQDGTDVSSEIGNGTKAVVTVKPREWTYQRKKGIALDAKKIVVTELVERKSREEILETSEVL